GNPVKKILLKLNLSDHRLFKDGGGDFRYSDTTHLSQSVEVLKLKNFKKDATLKLSKSTNQESSRNKLNPKVNDHYNIFKNACMARDDINQVHVGDLEHDDWWIRRVSNQGLVMSSPTHPTSDVDDAFSFNFPNYIPASSDYFLASSGNTSSESSNNSSGLVPIASPTLSLFHNYPYMKVMQAYDAISPPQVTIPPPIVVPPSLMPSPMFDSRDFFPLEEIPPPKDTKTPAKSPIPISPSSSVGSSSPIRSTTLPSDYPFDESIFAELDNSLWIIPRPLGSELVPEESNEMPPKRTSTSVAPAMTQAAIKKQVADSVSTNANNTNRNTEEREAPVARKCSYKEFMSCQPINFKGSEGAVGLIR
ncbi:hypothetical protein Tco_0865010, partial [Tanacetum coccineum]